VILLLAVAVAGAAATPISAGASRPSGAPRNGGAEAANGWVRPVPGPVVRPFAPPPHPYGPGHRGVDLAAPAGTPVVAAGPGRVVFAGPVAGHLHVVVRHPPGWRTTYAFLDEVRVRAGTEVRAGSLIGHTGGAGSAAGGHPGALHFALRVGERYVDPMALFSGRARIRLRLDRRRAAPSSPTVERAGLARVMAFDRVAGLVGSAAGRLVRDGAHAAVAAPQLAVAANGRLVRGAVTAARAVRSGIRPAGRAVPVSSLVTGAWRTLARFGAAFAGWWTCRSDPPVPGPPGSGHRLLAVAGLDSATDPRTGATMPLAYAGLGYRDDEVHWFSYLGPGAPYRRRHTWGGIARAARRLDAHLRDLQRREPGREVDLVAHSLGGVVVATYLAFVYDPADPGLPPLGPVVTLASPHLGVPLASLVAGLRTSRSGRAVLRRLDDARRGSAPLGRAAALAQIAEESPLLRRVWRAGVPAQVELTSIAALGDLAVPAPRTAAPGAETLVVDPAGWSDHRGVLTDPTVLARARAVLEGRRTCPDLPTRLAAAVGPVLVADLERHLARITTTTARGADHLRRGLRRPLLPVERRPEPALPHRGARP
jgi:murein DD-endopeptidase MepM/ murein hydrolase activator NlpD